MHMRKSMYSSAYTYVSMFRTPTRSTFYARGGLGGPDPAALPTFTIMIVIDQHPGVHTSICFMVCTCRLHVNYMQP